MSQKICFIGAGNLATHLSAALQKQGANIIEVFSRTEDSAKQLALKLGARYTTNPESISSEADMYVVALKDSVMDEVLSKFCVKNQLLVHCSGSLPLSVLEKYSNNIGVIYPLQSFSKHRYLNFSTIPVFIEANSVANQNSLLNLAKGISNDVSVLNSQKRKKMHIAAVFACNFVNHMYALAEEFLGSSNIPFDVVKPLLLETAQKVMEHRPKEVQTGPAVRFDENIINDHLNELQSFPKHQELYHSISKSIFTFYQEIEKNI